MDDKDQLKKKLHQYIDDLEDEAALEMLLETVVEYRKPGRKDILDELTPEQLKRLEDSLRQADNGQTIPHEEVMKLSKAWLRKNN